jgi:hypothetical protein
MDEDEPQHPRCAAQKSFADSAIAGSIGIHSDPCARGSCITTSNVSGSEWPVCFTSIIASLRGDGGLARLRLCGFALLSRPLLGRVEGADAGLFGPPGRAARSSPPVRITDGGPHRRFDRPNRAASNPSRFAARTTALERARVRSRPGHRATHTDRNKLQDAARSPAASHKRDTRSAIPGRMLHAGRPPGG